MFQHDPNHPNATSGEHFPAGGVAPSRGALARHGYVAKKRARLAAEAAERRRAARAAIEARLSRAAERLLAPLLRVAHLPHVRTPRRGG